MTFDEYTTIPAVNWSSLKPMRESPADALYAATHPGKESGAMDLGSAVDVSIFEPERLLLDFTVYRASKTTGEGARKTWDAFKAANAHRTILDACEWEKAVEIGRAVRRHKLAAEILSEGTPQQVIVWRDKGSGLWCKARLDWRRAPRRFADLKTARTINPFQFQRQAWGLGYFHQLAFYRRGVAAHAGGSVDAVTAQWIVVRNVPPHLVMVAEPDAASIDAADAEIDALLARLVECQRSGQWPGPAEDEVVTLHAPGYVVDDGAIDDLLIGGDDAREFAGAE